MIWVTDVEWLQHITRALLTTNIETTKIDHIRFKWLWARQQNIKHCLKENMKMFLYLFYDPKQISIILRLNQILGFLAAYIAFHKEI